MTRTERTYYVVAGLYSGAGWFLGPVYPLFLLSCGLDLLQMNLVLATFLICVFLFEVPTGAVADVFGRKVSFLLSCAVRAFAFGLYSMADSFTDCLVAEIIDAVGMTLATGALDAWAVDGMREEGHDGPVDRLFARANIVTRSLMVVGGIAGGYVASLSFSYAWLGGAFGFMLTGCVAAAMMRSDRPARTAARTSGSRPSVIGTIVEGWATVRSAPVLTMLCLVSLGLFFAAIPAHLYWQPRLQELSDEGVWLMGWIWALINVATLLGSWGLPRLLAFGTREQVLLGVTLFRSAALAVAAAATSLSPVLLGILMAEAGFGVTEPAMQAWMNERIPSEQRATVLSVRSMFSTLGGALGLVTMGLIARAHGIPAAWTACALVLAVVAPGFVVLGRLTVARRTTVPAAES
jgi:MFS family permease